MTENSKRLLRHGDFRQSGHINAVIPYLHWHWIIQCLRKQLPDTLDRMKFPGNRITAIIEPAGDRLPNRIPVIACSRGFVEPGQDSTFQQSLGVNDKIILLTAESLPESFPLATAPGLHKVFTPAPDCHGN